MPMLKAIITLKIQGELLFSKKQVERTIGEENKESA